MEFKLLGPVEVRLDGQPIDAGPARQRCVLAALAVDAGRPVRVETLIGRVWGDKPPRRVRHAVHVYIGRIREVVRGAGDGVAAVGTKAGGYVLDVARDQVDLLRFGSFVERARQRGMPDAEKYSLLGQALALWAGPALDGVPGEWADQVRTRWQRVRTEAALEWAQAGLRVGDSVSVIDTLFGLIAEDPLLEPAVGALMEALQARGNQADALLLYADLRSRLANELGADPSTELQRLHQAILRGERETAAAATHGASVRPPAQLPRAVTGFVGRTPEIAQLQQMLDQTSSLVCVLTGTAGVGKTSLALHWAHTARYSFPDGQLYVNLRGFDAANASISGEETVRGLLEALHVPVERIPASVEAQVALYRTTLADRRVLIVVDNVRDSEQVRPLLPGVAGCAVIVTSRNHLSSLVAVEGARQLSLDLMSWDEAVELLAVRLGGHRVSAEMPATKRLASLCARLPLALAVVAARAAANPTFSLDAIAADLERHANSLDGLRTGENDLADVRAAFSWSYESLTNEAAQLFRQVGLCPAQPIRVEALASLAGVSPAQVRPPTEELIRATMLYETAPGHFVVHDLLLVYARELSHRHDLADARREAFVRLLDHYLYSAIEAALIIDPHRVAIDITPASKGTTVLRCTTHKEALEWFDAHRLQLMAVVRTAVERQFFRQAWQLAWASTNYFDRRGLWHDQVELQRLAICAAEQAADLIGEAHANRGLGRALARTAKFRSAVEHLEAALERFQRLGDDLSQANTHLDYGWVNAREGTFRDALEHAKLAFALYQSAQHAGQADALNAIGWYHAQLGEFPEAIDYCERAMTLHRDLGNRHGQANAWDSLGFAHHRLGEFVHAAHCYEQAVDLLHVEGDRFNEAGALESLADAKEAGGDEAAAFTMRQRALSILGELKHPREAELRAKLAGGRRERQMS